jgi:hypothetical protein
VRLKKAGVMNLLVELEREVKAIEGYTIEIFDNMNFPQKLVLFSRPDS